MLIGAALVSTLVSRQRSHGSACTPPPCRVPHCGHWSLLVISMLPPSPARALRRFVEQVSNLVVDVCRHHTPAPEIRANERGVAPSHLEDLLAQGPGGDSKLP